MFRSLHMKLVLVLVMLVISVMAVLGAFLIDSVTASNIYSFSSEMNITFTPEFILTLNQKAEEQNAVSSLKEVLLAYALPLGIDENRSFYILDGKTGEYLGGSDDSIKDTLTVTPNIVAALSGNVGQKVERLSPYFDVAIPLTHDETVLYVVGVMDNRAALNDLTWNLFTILVRTMLFGLVVSILLSFILSKAITRPIERLTQQATNIAAGDFGYLPEIYSSDEIGILTETFNEMAEKLEDTLHKVSEERQKLDTIFSHMADGVVAFDSQGLVMHVNDAARHMLGKQIEMGAQYSDVFPNLQTNKEDFDIKGRYIEVDYAAGARILKIFFATFGIGEEGGLMAVLHDVTEQQKLERSRREFIANVSHELRTPLTNVKGYTETLLENQVDRETEKHFLEVVYNESDRMARIVKDLMTLSQIDYNRMEMKMSLVSLSMLAKKSVEAMRMEAEAQHVLLVSELPGETLMVNADQDRIEQVLINIISNAIKYNRPEGSVTITGGVAGTDAFIKVTDTGFGIPKADQGRIFERFYRVDKARSRSKGGTGLGLAIAKEIVEIHGGRITFESQENVGSEVTVFLPCAKGERHA